MIFRIGCRRLEISKLDTHKFGECNRKHNSFNIAVDITIHTEETLLQVFPVK